MKVANQKIDSLEEQLREMSAALKKEKVRSGTCSAKRDYW